MQQSVAPMHQVPKVAPTDIGTRDGDVAITRIWVLLKDWGVTAGGMGEISSPSDQGVLGLSQGHLAESSRVIL